MILSKAVVTDIEPIFHMIASYAKDGILLPRTKLSLYENMQCMTVAKEDGEVVGCGSLHVLGHDLAEVRSLVVAQNQKGKGTGRAIVEQLMEEATSLGVEHVFSMTYEVLFFEKCGFEPVDKESMPEKIWKDCLSCPKLRNCDENAMIRRTNAYIEQSSKRFVSSYSYRS
ncbi:N-acetyltransferase [Bacillus solimangrovi]|uniref:GNAT family N-acetyltransferase n=1 Tax=Bacillus solimangrovi TaxID=1305675 RepID=A0A1E5LJD0_9BACI|nr:N-acetyltransferase [Bacillus solimangrovi]OEH94202.1 GNAT family N-acetyltransferase [Bacillus solimangrovi]